MLLSGIGTWRDFDSIYLCLVLNALALVLSVLDENLDALKCWWLGTAAGDGRTGPPGAPPDTVRCASHVTQPLGFDRWISDMWGHRTVRWCTGQHCSLSGAPSAPALTSARAVRAL
jgi:hypothetical protein